MKGLYTVRKGRNYQLISQRQLRLARTALGMTISEAAKFCSVSTPSYQRIEAGSKPERKIQPWQLERIVKHYELEGIVFMRDDQDEGIWYRRESDD